MKRIDVEVGVVCLLLSCLFVLSLSPASAFHVDSLVAQESASMSTILVKKTRFTEVEYDPEGVVKSSKVNTVIEVSNKGGEDQLVDLVDRAENILPDNLVMIGNTPEPSSIEDLGPVVKVSWRALRIQAGQAVTYEYVAEARELPPIFVTERIYISGRQVNVTVAEGAQMIEANVSDVVTWSFTVNRQISRQFSGYHYVLEPILASVSVSIDEDSFTGISTSPEANTTMTLGGARRLSWIVVLGDDPVTLNVSARLASSGGWGVVSVDSVTIQTIDDPRAMLEQLKSSIRMLSANIEASREAGEVFGGFESTISFLLESISETSGMMSPITGLSEDVLSDLEDVQSGMEALTYSSDNLSDQGLDQMLEGLNQSNVGIDELNAALNATKQINEDLLISLDLLSKGFPGMVVGMKEMSRNLGMVAGFMETIAEGMVPMGLLLDSTISEVQSMIGDLESILDQIGDPDAKQTVESVISRLYQTLGVLNTLDDNFGGIVANVTVMAEGTRAAAKFSREMAKMFEEMGLAVEGMEMVLQQEIEIMDGILTGLSEAQEANQELIDALNQTIEAQRELQNQSDAFSEAMEQVYEGMIASVNAIEQLSGALIGMEDLLASVMESSSGFSDESTAALTELEGELSLLRETAALLEYGSNKAEFSGVEVEIPGVEASFTVAPVVRNSSSSWIIEKVYVEPHLHFAHNATAVVYSLFLRFQGGARVKSIEALIGREWVGVQNLTSLGVSYGRSENEILVPLYREINVSSLSNVLVGPAGHPLRITIGCVGDPDIKVDGDVAFYPSQVSLDRTDSGSKISLIQPQVLVSRVAVTDLTTITTVPSAAPGFLLDLALGALLTLVAAVLLIAADRVLRRRKLGEKPPGVEVVPSSVLMERIEQLEKLVKEETEKGN